MNAMQSDNKLFHQLVQNQRKQKPNVDFMMFNEQEVDDTDKILEGWKDYFSELYSTVIFLFCVSLLQFVSLLVLPFL
jgi:hypothetical protein